MSSLMMNAISTVAVISQLVTVGWSAKVYVAISDLDENKFSAIT